MAVAVALAIFTVFPASAAGPFVGAWGLNNFGQLGDGTTTNRNLPVQVLTPPGVTFTFLSGGFAHTMALDTTGRAWAWGLNVVGQLGDGTNTNRLTPVSVQMPPGVTFEAISVFEVHSLALDTAGRAWGWGWNRRGQVGDGTTTNRNAPTQVQMPPGVTFASVNAGVLHSVALDTTGRAWAWGDNTSGELGTGNNITSPVPVAVQMPPGVTFTAVSAGLNFSLALDTLGRAWSWGQNVQGQLGDGSNTNRNAPVQVVRPPGVTFTQIATLGDIHGLALGTNGRAYAWGDNARGQLGDGTNTDRNRAVGVLMPPGVTFSAIQTGDFNSYGLATDGAEWAWGWNNWGQLGDGTNANRNTPVRVQTPPGATVSFLGAGDHHGLAMWTTP